MSNIAKYESYESPAEEAFAIPSLPTLERLLEEERIKEITNDIANLLADVAGPTIAYAEYHAISSRDAKLLAIEAIDCLEYVLANREYSVVPGQIASAAKTYAVRKRMAAPETANEFLDYIIKVSTLTITERHKHF